MDFSRGGYFCPCCEKKISYYKPYGTKKLRMNAECPFCRGAERDRIEFLYYRNKMELKKDMKILHFAPEKSQYEYFLDMSIEDYWPVDIDASVNMIRKAEDITAISFDADTFDLIICNQVLEHVENGDKAISELARVLRKDGICILTVPLNENNVTLEKEEINTDKLRIRYYGEANHVRMYGSDFGEILYRCGLTGRKIYAKELADKNVLHAAGLKRNEYFWICRKS